LTVACRDAKPGARKLAPAIGRIFRVGEALEHGMVGIDTGLIAVAEVPFGGVKQSGLGREGSGHVFEDYVEMKYLCLGDINR
jgi:succinate-semialdehyde dehydrogenase/glutarate-semialdehyde dehydrogenase